MKITLYDYSSHPKICEIKDKPIQSFVVEVISGDETVTVLYEDGTDDYFDSRDDRFIDYRDGWYFVDPKRITEWNSFPFKKGMPYERQTKQWWGTTDETR